MKRKNTDLDAIARRIGVSKTTVHYALHNTGRVSDRLRERILKLARKLDYRPNLLARSLRSQRTATIGVVSAYLSSTYFANVLAGIEDTARMAGRSILLSCSYENAQREREAVQLLIDKGVDGLIVAPSNVGQSGEAGQAPNADLYRELVENGGAIVFVDRSIPRLGVTLVATDNVLGGYLAGQHLLRLGRRRIAMVVAALHGPLPTSVQSRIEGVNRALSEAGASGVTMIGPEVTDNSADGAYRAMQTFLSVHGRSFDAVFAANDGLAFGAMRALTESGARIPADVPVIGFDDQEASAYFQPPLTTIRQPMREIGAEAVRLLIRQMEDPGATVARQVLLEPTLIVRKSCGADATA